MKTPTITSTELVHEGRFLHVERLHLAHLNGEMTAYEVAKRNAKKVFGIVSVLPITEDGNIVMIRQYRAPLDRIGLELPAGCAEVGKHASLEDAVHAELREETGYVSDTLTHLAEFSSSSGMTNETVHGFVAHHCRRMSDVLTLDQDEYIEQILVPYTQFDHVILSEIARGAIIEPKMMAMMYMWRNMLAKG